MKKDLLEMVWILDRSGSMSGLESDTVGGFNSMIERQKKLPGEVYVSTVLFNNHSKVLHDRVPIEKIEPLTENEYVPSGCTALLDAIGGAIRHIKNIHKYARPEDVPEHTVFVITTDGMENASRRYDSAAVKRMIEQAKQEHGWEFLFLAANIDAVETAANIGVSRERAVNYNADDRGTELLYAAVSSAVSKVRASVPLGAGWGAAVERDHATRAQKR